MTGVGIGKCESLGCVEVPKVAPIDENTLSVEYTGGFTIAAMVALALVDSRDGLAAGTKAFALTDSEDGFTVGVEIFSLAMLADVTDVFATGVEKFPVVGRTAFVVCTVLVWFVKCSSTNAHVLDF
jgi:hypothetical protein